MGKGKSGGEIEVNEYLMSMHVGVCSSADALTSIYVGEKLAWSGEVTTESAVYIDKTSLFGGEKKEGGVRGTVTYLPGLPTQVLPDVLAQKLGRGSGADCPGFRGVASLFFTGGAYTGGLASLVKVAGVNSGYYGGFHWVTNNPYLKDIWVGVRRAPKGLNPAQALIPRFGASGYVNFAAGKTATVTWWQSSFNQSPSDKARMGIGFINDQGELIGDITWALMVSTTPMVWTERSVSATSPAGTIGLRVYMEMERVSGSNNDGYIDDIAFTFDGVTVPLTNFNAEATSDFGWVTETGNLGIRSSNPDPHGGASYFTGGSSLKTRAYQTITNAATGPDANPAHMIYECLTNRDWGMGGSPSGINIASFEEAGTTLLFERFGLSMIWTRQTTIEAFIQEILDHIQAVLFVNPADGLLTLRLIRGGYDVSELREITPDDAVMKNFQRLSWGEVTNEIVVTWTNPETEGEETVSLQDNAAVAAQGGEIVSDSRNYYGVRSAELAMLLAARDLRTASTPLASCEVELDRKAWNLAPGEVVKLTWPERGLNALPMRVGPVNYGKPGDMKITASLLEDIFSYATTDYSTPPTTEWQGDDIVPAPMAHSKIITVPSFFAANYLPTVGTGLANIEYPEVVAGVLASSPNAVGYDIYGQRVAVDGTIVDTALTTNTVSGWATLTTPLGRDAESTYVGFTGMIGQVRPGQNVFVFIGSDDATDEDCEIALITETTGSSFTLKRGILDTIPRIWDAGTPVYFVDIAAKVSDLIVRSDAEVVEYQLLSRTVGGILAVDDAPVLSGTLSGRPHYPLRPANVKVNGNGVGPVNVNGLDPIPVTWANRNRTLENSQVVYWSDATVTPETGQTTTVEVLDGDGTVVQSYTGLTGTSQNVPASALGGRSFVRIRVKSVRDGFDSLQAYEIACYADSGYGLAYGLNYGGGTPGTGGGSGGGGGSGTYPDNVTWIDTYTNISSTSYAPLTSTKTLSLTAGETLYGEATLNYTAVGGGTRSMRAKWQYSVHGAETWVDFGAGVRGTLTGGDTLFGEVTVTQEVEGLPANDYDIRMVAIINAGGDVLTTTGTATAYAAV